MKESEWDGQSLPSRWNHISPWSKGEIIKYLQGRNETAPPCWWNMSAADRRQVVLHLCAVGSVSAIAHPNVREYGFGVFDATRKAQRSKSFVGQPMYHPMFGYRDGCVVPKHTALPLRLNESDAMLYPKPNGRQRILPSIYTRLRGCWLRGNKVYQNPATMNQGHLRNTCELLKESHVNLIDRMHVLLGKMHAHLDNRPDIQRDIEDLFHKLETVDVSELYPIFDLIAWHIEPEIGQTTACMEDSDWLREF